MFRKAVGFRKSDIYVVSLSESKAVSLFGTVIEIVLGILTSLAIAPIVHQIVEIPFNPAFSLLTISVITIFSLLIGILFGTYPAYKANQLSPINRNTDSPKQPLLHRHNCCLFLMLTDGLHHPMK